jgi:DNA sulfur modification protein DndB
MNDNLQIELLGKLAAGKEIQSLLKPRKRNSVLETIKPKHLEAYIDDGWEIDREFKETIRVKKEKPMDMAFEDRVWSLFAQLGFNFLNRDRQFHLPYDKKDPSLTQQIDVLAKDDETILLIECKTAKTNKRGDFKEALEAMLGKINGLRNSLNAMFPNVKHKIKFILATKNLSMNDEDRSRLAKLGGTHFDEENIDYFYQLFSQIGPACKYQLLGLLFEGQEIPEMDNRVPAVEGAMGGHKYYAFSIEPENLLKIGFVLHRNRANVAMMPTYQRLIKKGRLKSVHEFIEGGGYFPNSIVISIEAKKNEECTFHQTGAQVEHTKSRVGILHLPKKYRSAFIIDGQHRLYGYANSHFKSSNTIPVVAFLNLSREEQVKLFMEINENQKAVSKDLQNTLNADLLWTSPILTDQIKALCARIGIYLGEDRESPLYGMVSIGEDKRNITTQAIQNALKRSSFLGKVTRTKIEELGTIYNGNLDQTYDKLKKLLAMTFTYVAETVSDEWEKGEDGMLAINKGVYGIIMVLGDILTHLQEKGVLNVRKSNANDLFNESKTYLDALVVYLRDMPLELKVELKGSLGSTAETKYWKFFQRAIHNVHSEFNPADMENWFKDQEKEHNARAIELIRDIETFMNADFKEKLEEVYGPKWFKNGVPPKIGDKAVVDALTKNREIEDEANEVEPWDCLMIIAYREIATKNWMNIFEKHYTRPGEEKISGGKEEKTKWMFHLEQVRNKAMHHRSVSEDELSFLESLNEWLIKKELRNKFQMEDA